MTHIKLCGMRRPEDIDAVNRLLPDYIGFIFAPKSRRYVTKDEAASLRKALDRRIRAVGVFVNAAEDEILVPVREGIIDDVQLHGVETPAMIRQLRAKLDAGGFSETRIIKAFSMTSPEDTADPFSWPVVSAPTMRRRHSQRSAPGDWMSAPASRQMVLKTMLRWPVLCRPSEGCDHDKSQRTFRQSRWTVHTRDTDECHE